MRLVSRPVSEVERSRYDGRGNTAGFPRKNWRGYAMKRDAHSSEFADRNGRGTEQPAQTYAKGDRVQIRATGALATVAYSLRTARGHFVTLVPDGAGKSRVVVTADKITRIESLF